MGYLEDKKIRMALKARGKSDDEIDILLAVEEPEEDVSDEELAKLLTDRGLNPETLLCETESPNSHTTEPENSEQVPLEQRSVSLGDLVVECCSRGYEQCLIDVKSHFQKVGIDVSPMLSQLNFKH